MRLIWIKFRFNPHPEVGYLIQVVIQIKCVYMNLGQVLCVNRAIGILSAESQHMLKTSGVFFTIGCSRSFGRGLRAEVYVMVECSYFAYTSRLTVCP